MFDADEIKRIPEWLGKVFLSLEYDVIMDIVRRLSLAKEITRSADWQLYRVTQLRTYERDYKKLIQTFLGSTEKELDQMLREMLEKSYARDKRLYEAQGIPFVPLEENDQMLQLMDAVYRQTVDAAENITRTQIIVIRGPTKLTSETPVAYFQRKLNEATVEISTGVFDYNAAIKKTVSELASSGIRVVEGDKGRRWSIDVAARRAIMTGLAQLTGQVAQINAEKLGTDYFEVSAHPTARPSHAVWQGRVYSSAQLKTICGLGTGPGLCGWNCYHHYDAFIPGISKRKYTDEDLRDMLNKAQTVKEYGGKRYTMYEATQAMRAMERAMRRQELDIAALNAAGEDSNPVKIRRRETYKRYKDFAETFGLQEEIQRVTLGREVWKGN